MQTHDFLAECPECSEITFWRKANQEVDGAMRKGFKCVECGQFDAQVEDTRGKLRSR
jgi:predicted RNA-binding Zn-ribbon protein involved in translation (DUF1610 family)